MKLKEAFAKRKTYERSGEIRINSLKRALEEYARITGVRDPHKSHLWKEVQLSVKAHMDDYPGDDPIYWTYNVTVGFLEYELKKAFEKM